MRIKILFLIFLTFPSSYLFSQKSLNGNLISRLDSLKIVDQFWRAELRKLRNGEAVSTAFNENEISKKNTPDLKELSNKFINDLLEIGVNLNMVEDILIYLDCKLRYIE